jgi:hypothetical protein
VDHPGGEPQDLAFQFLQMAQVLMQHVSLRWWPLNGLSIALAGKSDQDTIFPLRL